jgi:hypothetical protein
MGGEAPAGNTALTHADLAARFDILTSILGVSAINAFALLVEVQ